MSELNCKIFDSNGKSAGTLTLDPEVFGVKVNAALVHDTVVWQLAKRRQGTHHTLTKGEMKGGGKKPWKQKGTGRARAGSNTSPLWVGGGIIFGPKPRSYESRVTKRTRRQALASILSQKVADGDLLVLEDLKVKSGKTRDIAALLQKIGVNEGGVVIMPANAEDFTNIDRMSRNIPEVMSAPVAALNVYDLVRHRFLVSTREGISLLEKRVKGVGGAEDTAEVSAKPVKTKKASNKTVKSRSAAKGAKR